VTAAAAAADVAAFPIQVPPMLLLVPVLEDVVPLEPELVVELVAVVVEPPLVLPVRVPLVPVVVVEPLLVLVLADGVVLVVLVGHDFLNHSIVIVLPLMLISH